jgi:hypothetical protein
MRRVLTAAVVSIWLLPAHGAAQTNGSSSAASSSGSAASTGPRDLFRAGPTTYAPSYDRLPAPYRQRSTGRFVYGGYAYGTGYSTELPVTERYMQRSDDLVRQYSRRYEPGRLRLDVEPGSARVFVDGTFVGTVDEINYRSGGFPIAPGSHRVTVLAAGYESAGTFVRVNPGESVLYREYLDQNQNRFTSRFSGAFIPVSRYSRVPAPATLYVIPGCYAGDAMPRAEQLRPGCAIENVRTVRR